MSNLVVLPVILAGGSGERLWPLSRRAQPKQFLTILDAKVSLFQSTLQRLPRAQGFLPPLIVCHEDHRFLVAEQLRSIDVAPSGIILEPQANNTAPAIALAAQWAATHYPEAILLILPADHYMPDRDAFALAITNALQIAKKGGIATFGIKVSRAETGFGYIEKGQEISKDCFKIKKFIEKPDADKANAMITDNYFWNSGIFIFSSKCYLQELQKFEPSLVGISKDAMDNASNDIDFIRPNINCYKLAPSISIDYAIMEKTEVAHVVALNCSWSDVGSWQAVWQHSKKDQHNNASQGDVVMHNTKNCLIEARHRLIATLGIEDLAIIETNDAVMISKRDNSSELKSLVETLKIQGHQAATENRHVMRPWGFYDSLIKSERFQVKLLLINPGKSISLQQHNHRSEHWIVVKGSAKVIRGAEQFVLAENESTFIPNGTKHQLSNPGKIPLEVIEVQSGSYLGEDDIIRFEEEHAYA